MDNRQLVGNYASRTSNLFMTLNLWPIGVHRPQVALLLVPWKLGPTELKTIPLRQIFSSILCRKIKNRFGKLISFSFVCGMFCDAHWGWDWDWGCLSSFFRKLHLDSPTPTSLLIFSTSFYEDPRSLCHHAWDISP